MNTEKNSDASRRARQELSSKVRNDWDSVLAKALLELSNASASLPNGTSSNDTSSPSPASESELEDGKRYPFRQKQKSDPQDKPESGGAAETAGGDALEWRERTYASSDPSSGEDSLPPSPTLPQKLGIAWKKSKEKESTTAERGLSGEGNQLEQGVSKEKRRRAARKLRRQKRLEEEMAQNPGLTYFYRRRNIWCMSCSVAQTHTLAPLQNLSPDTNGEVTEQHNSQPQSPTSTTQLLPVAPPLLSPLVQPRPKITPALYGTIFDRVVTQSLAPNAPINLSHVVRATVAGWQANGEWPLPGQQQTATATATAGPARKNSLKSSSAAAAAAGAAVVRKLRLVDDVASKGKRLLGHGGDAQPAAGENSPQEPAEAGEDEDDAAALAGPAEKDGSGTPTSGSTSPLKARINSMREWARR